MEAKKKPAKNDKTERNINDFAVGDHVKVNMHRGRIVDATIKAIIDHTDGKRLQVDFGKDETALIHLWRSFHQMLKACLTLKYESPQTKRENGWVRSLFLSR